MSNSVPKSLRRNGVALRFNKRVWNAVLGCNLKNNRMIYSFPRQTIQHHSDPRLCLNHYCQRRSWSWPFLWRSIRPKTNTKKKINVLFITGDWNVKVGIQETAEVIGKYGLRVQNEEGQRLIEFFQENAWIIANTLFQQHKGWLYTLTSPDGQYQNQTDYSLCSWRWRSSILSVKTRHGTDCGSDHELSLKISGLNWRK